MASLSIGSKLYAVGRNPDTGRSFLVPQVVTGAPFIQTSDKLDKNGNPYRNQMVPTIARHPEQGILYARIENATWLRGRNTVVEGLDTLEGKPLSVAALEEIEAAEMIARLDANAAPATAQLALD